MASGTVDPPTRSTQESDATPRDAIEFGDFGAVARPWREASKLVRRWIRAIPRGTTVVVLVGDRPDAIAASAILATTLAGAGWNVRLVSPAKGDGAWAATTLATVKACKPGAVVAAGSGSPVDWPTDLPLLALDHRPLSVASTSITTVSGADWAPRPSSSSMAFWLFQGIADLRRLDWIAAVGTLGALGEKTDHILAVAARKAYGASWLRELLHLVQAAHTGDELAVEAAVSLLQQARDPKDAVTRTRPERDQLARLRAATEAAIDEAKQSPLLTETPISVVRVGNAFYVQAVLASIWQSRRPNAAVLIGNDAYLPGRVAFGTNVAHAEWRTPFYSALPPGVVLAEQDAIGILCGHMEKSEWLNFLATLGVSVEIWS